MNSYWKIWIDTGGTFTDCLAMDPTGNLQRIKVLSSGKLRGIINHYHRNELQVSVSWPLQADIFTGYQLRIDGDDEQVYKIISSEIRHGKIVLDKEPEHLDKVGFDIFSGEEAPILAARIATKSMLNENLPLLNMRLGSTKGTNALLEKKGSRVALIVSKGLTDLLLIGTQQRPDLFALNIKKNPPLYLSVIEVDERIDAQGNTLIPMNSNTIAEAISRINDPKIEAVAIALMSSYQNDTHEVKLQKALIAHGINDISISSTIAKEIGIIPRAQTTVVNAYLSKVIKGYLDHVCSKISEGNLQVMTSAGGLVDSRFFMSKDSLLSGPAGGVVGSAKIASRMGYDKILTFDMGGTSTDVSRFNGKFDYRFISEINQISIFSPALAIETVAAGGGSICVFDGYKLQVGPESAGASPGPACYGNHGPLAITDVNLLLGRIDPGNFSIPLDKRAAILAFQKVKDSLENVESDEEVLMGFLRIANEKTAEAIRKISFSKGYDPSEYTLLAFGGAGGQHACDVAELLRINKIIAPYDAGLLSAYGIGNANIERIISKQLLQLFPISDETLKNFFDSMESEATNLLNQEGISKDHIYVRSKLVYMRFEGQENTIEIEFSNSLYEDFKSAYLSLFGHWLDHEKIEVESIKLIACAYEGKSYPTPDPPSRYIPTPEKTIDCYISGEWDAIPVFIWENLRHGAQIDGPSLLLSNNSTVIIGKKWKLSVEIDNNAVLEQIELIDEREIFSEVAELELFTNRFKSVAEDMGAILKRTSFSVNVKDRMDFSCAVLDAKGFLVANAPHIPVHLGSLGVCTRKLIETLNLQEGDVAITNHPGFGGSHLPDITLIAPVYYKNKLIAFVANRAHHAELGGMTPGSMPASATNLAQEGVVIKPTFLVKQHLVNWEEIKNILSGEPFPTRALEENLADLNGALASIKTGIRGIISLCESYGSFTVQKYMSALLDYSGEALLKTFNKFEDNRWRAEEFLDDGHKIKVSIAKSRGQIEFDFSGSADVHRGNLNANLAIVNSAVIYVLRLMLEEPLPLNEGIMKYVRIKVPEGMLNPSFYSDPESCPAVVGGNTETSQRIVDTLIKAFKLAACSQGTMNNLIFGNENFGFYETIGGGVGAGYGFHGADAIHQHMTNTRITDPEVFEFRYPVILEEMGIRKNSGGKGKWHGGDGIIRQLRFMEDVILTLLSQHRKERPYGMDGGEPGVTGKQMVVRANGEKIELKGLETIEIREGDVLRIETPGGGGYGKHE